MYRMLRTFLTKTVRKLTDVPYKAVVNVFSHTSESSLSHYITLLWGFIFYSLLLVFYFAYILFALLFYRFFI